MQRRQFFSVAATGATVSLAGCASVQAQTNPRLACPEPVDGLAFELYREKREDGAKGDWRWRLWSRNKTDIIATSGEGYKNESGARNGIRLVRASFNATVDDVENR